MREKDIEHKLVMAVKRWLVLLHDGKLGFVELKAPGKHPRPIQTARHKMLKRLGFKVYVIDSPEQIGGVIDAIQSS